MLAPLYMLHLLNKKSFIQKMNVANFSQQNLKTKCSLVAQVVSLACLIGIARCLEAFQCVTELVLLHNRCQMVPLNELLFFGGGGGIYLQFVKYCGIKQGVVNLPSLPQFNSTLPTAAPSGICISFHTWCWFPPWSQQSFKTTTLSFTNRCHIRPTDSLIFFL